MYLLPERVECRLRVSGEVNRQDAGIEDAETRSVNVRHRFLFQLL
jgi:hypothetical protein